MPYHYVVSRIVRGIWRRVNTGDLDAPSRMSAAGLRFTVVGDTVIGGSWQGRDAIRDWLHSFAARFTDLRFEVEDVALSGWPWRTRVAIRLVVGGTLPDGTAYRNNATQWLTLRWGRMTDDWVLEDTKVVDAGLGRAS
ncbi:nuclear transport factor 2 family protein [Amycolatopsis jiangsuensis]|uniref:Ketosteroid isomerase-like protein n=1 Tax=Amycolatopsis jiangsuensis TaxID=1181879 RepID=A0A840IV80_9PSEU|nr:nuclear transport factor 2 family protein [Amycolatopsis jiangsuensis]MBB4685780.1 ketosteroid isomerase-like protein [Amycolatopsis jiangsuensis]